MSIPIASPVTISIVLALFCSLYVELVVLQGMGDLVILTVFILVILLALLVFWYVSAKVHELALKAARDICQRENWQLLDDTVSLKKISLGRGSDGRVHFRRDYQFAYTQYHGECCEKTIVMLGSEPIYKTETKANVIEFPITKRKVE